MGLFLSDKIARRYERYNAEELAIRTAHDADLTPEEKALLTDHTAILRSLQAAHDSSCGWGAHPLEEALRNVADSFGLEIPNELEVPVAAPE